MSRVLVDSGFLVAMFRRTDRLRAAARDYLRDHAHPLMTPSPVMVETCFFLDARGKTELLQWVQRGGLTVAEVPVAAYSDIETVIGKYADRDIDFTDAAIVWFAGATACRRILTVDERDFSVYRLKGGKHFEVIPWRR